ncbi:MAG: DUF3820 family protein [Chitinophagaceae bacterium]|nr:DUF3820 family protein [Chitinophagaceae bacterium]
MDKLTDYSIMSFGIHKGKPLIKVPAHYLIWLYENNKCNEALREYIKENMDVLKHEAKKGK